jgi:hypothetical protein
MHVMWARWSRGNAPQACCQATYVEYCPHGLWKKKNGSRGYATKAKLLWFTCERRKYRRLKSLPKRVPLGGGSSMDLLSSSPQEATQSLADPERMFLFIAKNGKPFERLLYLPGS